MKWLLAFLTVMIAGSVQAQEATVFNHAVPQIHSSVNNGSPVYVPDGLTPESHFWWLSCYSKDNRCCVDSHCSETVSYDEFVKRTVLPEYREKTRIIRIEDWSYGRKIIWIVRE